MFSLFGIYNGISLVKNRFALSHLFNFCKERLIWQLEMPHWGFISSDNWQFHLDYFHNVCILERVYCVKFYLIPQNVLGSRCPPHILFPYSSSLFLLTWYTWPSLAFYSSINLKISNLFNPFLMIKWLYATFISLTLGYPI